MLLDFRSGFWFTLGWIAAQICIKLLCSILVGMMKEYLKKKRNEHAD